MTRSVRSVAPTAAPESRGRALAPAVPGSGRPLPGKVREVMEPLLGHDFSQVRIHSGPLAADAARARGARAYSLGPHLVFAGNAFHPATPTGRALLAHELAHVVQHGGRLPPGANGTGAVGPMHGPPPGEQGAEAQARGAARAVALGRPAPTLTSFPPALRLQPTSLGAVPEGERKGLRVGTTSVTVPDARIRAFFTPGPNGPPAERRSMGDATSFDPSIDAALHAGLTSVGAWLAGDTNALPLGSSVEVALDLTAWGGAHTTYRFTRFTHTTGTGSAATSSRVMLIEPLGAAAGAPAPVTVPEDGSFTIGSTSFRLSGSWSEADYALLRQALALLPPAALAIASGMTFRRRGRAPGPEGGEYHADINTVDLFNSAFPAAESLRVGGRSRGVHYVLHEVGHAIDLIPLEQAWQTFSAAGQSTRARTALLAARSPSGTRYVRDDAGDYQQEQALDDTRGDFRRAVRSDGVRRDTSGRTTPEGTTAELSGGITTYSETDYQELYAELFALYVNAPETLRLLRPATFRYFQGRFPNP